MKCKILRLFLQFILVDMQCRISRAFLGEGFRNVNPGEFVSAVPILRITNNTSPQLNLVCSGVLISNRDVLTSAHCLENEQLSEIKILVGSHDIRNGAEFFPSWWITYDEWAEENEIELTFRNNDLCLIRLKSNVSLENFEPAKVTNVARDRLHLHLLQLVGWGEVNSNTVPQVAQTADVSLLNRTACIERVRNISRRPTVVPENNLCCVGERSILVNIGDSGGPLYYRKRYLIGVTRGTCPNVLPLHELAVNLHVDLACYMDFLSSVMYTYQ